MSSLRLYSEILWHFRNNSLEILFVLAHSHPIPSFTILSFNVQVNTFSKGQLCWYCSYLSTLNIGLVKGCLLLVNSNFTLFVHSFSFRYPRSLPKATPYLVPLAQMSTPHPRRTKSLQSTGFRMVRPWTTHLLSDYDTILWYLYINSLEILSVLIYSISSFAVLFFGVYMGTFSGCHPS